jgi:hypothetical protein
LQKTCNAGIVEIISVDENVEVDRCATGNANGVSAQNERSLRERCDVDVLS